MPYDFDTIAARYDRMNHLMTAGLDRRWRRLAVRQLGGGSKRVLDVACGSGDMMVELSRQGHSPVGIDLSREMISVARQKVHFQLLQGDAMQMPFASGMFDAVTCAFGVRNFANLEGGLSEMLRVLKPGGMLVVLELSTPDSPLVRPFYSLYAERLIPLLGGLVAGNRQAYTYLPRSIRDFPKGEAFGRIVRKLDADCRERRLTFGVCRLYTITKRPPQGDLYAINPKTKMGNAL